jgi:NAD(P)-dependent dehydrogenase (short-subunit alcohol dehydrogenase family)
VLLGGRSEIGLELVRALLPDGPRDVVLASRPGPATDPTIDPAVDLVAAGASTVRTVDFDADDLAGHRAVLTDALAGAVGPPVVVLAFGVLGDQARAERDAAHAAAVAHTDYVAQVSVLTHLRDLLGATGGTVVVFSSVAGVRVRRANYVYGSAKAGLDGFVSGLQDSLHGSPLRVVLVRPGFVVGRMTTGMAPAPMSSTPAQVAAAVAAAVAGGRDTVWVPGRLRWLALALGLLPRPVWRRLPR